MLKEYSANNISFYFSFFLSIFIGILLFIGDLIFSFEVNWNVALIYFLIAFIFSFLLLRTMILSFLYKRIRLIYKTINQHKTGKPGNPEKFNYSTDLIRQVNSDVNRWMEEQEQKMNELINLSNYRKEFVGNVSHELKTPIFNIQGYTITLLEGGLKDDSINEKYLRKIEKNINRMINIVTDLDSITKLESGQLKLRMQSFNPVEICKDCIEAVEEISKEKKIKIEIIKHYDKNYYCIGDKEYIRQVFSNLIINAINYNNEGGFVKAEFFDMDENILVEITDNGIGIPAEDLPRIFERFYRVDKSRSLNSGGSGLGLAIVKHIIEAHGQKVNARSTLGVGTTIAFTLQRDM